MKKAIHIAIIILFLIAICTTEQILFQSYLKETEYKVDEILKITNSIESLDNQNLLDKTLNLESYWKEKENIICTFVNHREIEEIGVEINKLKSALEENEKNIFLESLNLIQFYLKSYQHIIGVNFQSLF